MSTSSRLYPVILSGGSGTRLWPLSRAAYPKQFLALAGEKSLLQETALRVSDAELFHRPLLICNEEHRFLVGEQLRDIAIEPMGIVLEPEGRNSGPAIAVAAEIIRREDPEGIMLVLASDHVIRHPERFREAIATAAGAARAGRLVTFGIVPTEPHTGYGYIRAGAALDGIAGASHVAEFVEKPDRATAEGYLARGGYAWNSGNFVLPAGAFLDELQRLEPEMRSAAAASVDGLADDLDFRRLPREAFGKAPAKAVDVAVMERTDRAAVVATENLGWSDVGAWSALWDISEKDSAGNAVIGDVLLDDVRNSYLRSEHRLVAALGVEDLVVVETDTAVAIATRDRSGEVKTLVERLKSEGREEATHHARVYRPWGYYQSLITGERFQVKKISVNPGASLSLQRHRYRAEHWVVVNGIADVVRDDETIRLNENESVYIPLGAVHRLANPGEAQLNLIEVQSGSYLGEDDIERLEDHYGRVVS